jgi:nucleoside-diphosphate-sugar epimerase
MSASQRRIFVTGATGLVGSHVVEEALARGDHVRALVRPTSDTRWLNRLGIEQVVGDLADAQVLRAGVAGAEWVINCGARVGDWGPPEEFRRLNVVAFESLLEAAAAAGVKRLVHVSSLGVYEARDHFGTDETTPPAALGLDGYARSKVQAELLALRWWRERAFPITVVRPGFVYGPRDRTVLPKLLAALRSGRFAYFGSGDQALNCIFVKNLVHGIFLAAESRAAVGQVFNLTDGCRVSKRDFVERVAELAGLPSPRMHLPRWLAWFLAVLLERRAIRRAATEPPLINRARYKFLGLHLDYSIAKAERLLGYRPPYTPEEGLAASIADLVSKPAARAA